MSLYQENCTVVQHTTMSRQPGTKTYIEGKYSNVHHTDKHTSQNPYPCSMCIKWWMSVNYALANRSNLQYLNHVQRRCTYNKWINNGIFITNLYHTNLMPRSWQKTRAKKGRNKEFMNLRISRIPVVAEIGVWCKSLLREFSIWWKLYAIIALHFFRDDEAK
jgi:hypothetical protein